MKRKPAVDTLIASQPGKNRNAVKISRIRGELNCVTRFPIRCRETVTVLCKFTAQGAFILSESSRAISTGTPRTADVTGATVTVDK